MDKIKLNAVWRKNNKLYIVDQDGREFDFVEEWKATRNRKEVVGLDIELEAPYWPDLQPHVIVRFRMPVQVESESIQSLIDSMDRNLHGS